MPRKLLPPRRALWEITWKCDMRCAHCLVEGGSKTKEELNTEEAFDLVDQLSDLGVYAVSLTGGEPFLRRDWHDIASRIRKKGMRLRFSANGHFVDENLIERLVALETESFAVSLDGLRPTHDKVRFGNKRLNSSFDRVLMTLELLKKSPINPQVITTVTQQNLGELPALHSILKQYDVKVWMVQLGHPTGRLSAGKSNGICDPIKPGQLPRVADFIIKNAEDPVLQPRAFNSIGYLNKKEPIIRQSGRKVRNPIWRGCSCGKSVIGIEPDGSIKGCANQVGDPFIVGTIRKESLKEIWEDRSRWFWLNPTPDKMTGECADCALAEICHAGCTVLAYRSTGEFFNNPYCLRKIEKKLEGN